MLSTTCPRCQVRINYNEQSAGTARRCTLCGNTFALPLAAPPSPKKAATIGGCVLVVIILAIIGAFLPKSGSTAKDDATSAATTRPVTSATAPTKAESATRRQTIPQPSPTLHYLDGLDREDLHVAVDDAAYTALRAAISRRDDGPFYDPSKLKPLLDSGKVFAAPHRTRVLVLEEGKASAGRAGRLKVRVLTGDAAGRVGYIESAQVLDVRRRWWHGSAE